MKYKSIKNLLIYGLFPFTAFVACTQPQTNKEDALASHIDTTVNAGDDFFDYANGNWFKSNPIPASEQSNGIWQLIQDTINEQIKDICISSAADESAEKGSNKQKIGDFYFSGMDSVSLNNKGLDDLKPDLGNIDKIKTTKDLFEEAAYIHTVSSSPFFGFYIGQDDKISSKYAINLFQGGLSLPDRSYYLDNDARSKNIREKFTEYITNIFEIMGYEQIKADAAAKKILKMETDLARTSRKREDTRDPFTNYHKMTFAQLESLSPAIGWSTFMNKMGLNNIDSVIVGQPEFFTALNGYLKKYSIDDWKDYLKFQFVDGLSSYLDDKTFMEGFKFYSQTLRGIEEPKPRWKRVVGTTNGSLGELVGQVYVSEYLPKGAKEKLLEIGNAIKAEFANRIKNLDWMSDATKEKALAKLSTIVMKVGYPDKWKDMSTIHIDRTSYVKNVISANKWETENMIVHYGKPVDRNEWHMQPQTYNAYYNPSNNEIVIPGCNIIVPGYERKMADDAILYAIIGGSTFGHEITHGFDDQGSKYDAMGNLKNWWTPEDSAKFHNKTRMIVDQFNNYIVVDSLHINGEATQGENIADLGGIVMGYEAFKKTKQFKDNEMISSLTPSQRFFLGYALAWMVNTRPEALANQVKSDVHSPAKWRVIGPLSNMPEFYKTFGVQEGDKMWRSKNQRVKIW
ncbi:MAG: M13 family metallopeptidase [Paludibacter sp.]|nr:M13 family metallopeptidase [Paludibacter sp.]